MAENRRGIGVDPKNAEVEGKESPTGGISVVSGSITVHGDVAGRDLYTGLRNDLVIDLLFDQVVVVLEEKAPAEQRHEAEQKVIELREQAKASRPDPLIVSDALTWLNEHVPGLSAILKSVLNQPIMSRSIQDITAIVLGESRE